MKIDILCNDGSPIGVTESSIFGEDGRIGVGGAELSMLTLCRELTRRGHEVTVYNNPQPNGKSSFRHAKISEFKPYEKRDSLIIFRSPNSLADGAVGKKIWWSHDQYTVGDFKSFSKSVDSVVCVSEHHKDYFSRVYGMDERKIRVIDNQVRTFEYPDFPQKKEKRSFIFTSVPDRGLMNLLPLWKKISSAYPDATLTITSDWSLWSGNKDALIDSEVLKYKVAWAGMRGVRYLGAVRRKELIDLQVKSKFHLYPCVYPELFCISVAESQVAGVFPITSSTGALYSTNRMGKVIYDPPNSEEFVLEAFSSIEKLIDEDDLIDVPKAKKTFDLDKITTLWEEALSK